MAIMKVKAGDPIPVFDFGNAVLPPPHTYTPKVIREKYSPLTPEQAQGCLEDAGEDYRDEDGEEDTRTDQQVIDAVEKRSGDHYEPKVACVECGNDFAVGYCKHKTPLPTRTASPPAHNMPIKGRGDYPELRFKIKDWTTRFTGPTICDGCGEHDIVRTNGGFLSAAWKEHNSHGISYSAHHCTHIKIFKNLAGKVLTIIDASLTANPKQHKAVCDLLRKAFAESISKARELEGDYSAEETPREGLA